MVLAEDPNLAAYLCFFAFSNKLTAQEYVLKYVQLSLTYMRSTKIVGFSIPPELHKKFNAAIKKGHKTKSEFFREVLDVYFKTKNSTAPSKEVGLRELDLARALRSYWTLRASSDTKTIIIGLGIITENGKVLIGGRKEKDKWVENLTWVFPGGKMDSLNFEKEIGDELKEETGLEVKVDNLIAARVHPGSGFKTVQIVALYFSCSPTSKQKAKPGGDLSELKWVKPTEVFKHFTTSTCDEVTKFLVTLERSL